MAAKDRVRAEAIVRAVREIDPALIVFGSGEILSAAESAGQPAAAEVFADRSYQDDASLTPRGHVGAMIEDVSVAAAQVLQMVQLGTVTAVHGNTVPIDRKSKRLNSSH